MSFKYLASPYSHKDPFVREMRYVHTCNTVKTLALAGAVIYSPIVHWHEIAKLYEMPGDHEFWRRQDQAMMLASSGVIVLKLFGWQHSLGVEHEVAFAAVNKIPVSYMEFKQ